MKNYQPLISIIMNCYNSERYLKEAINSVLEQTYSNWEIIFWDNQSTDNSPKIAKEFNSERIRYFRSKSYTNLGAARVSAVKKAHGDWLVFLDCDDVWLPTFLSLHLEQIQQCNNIVGAVYSRINYIDASSKLIHKEFGLKAQCRPLPLGNIHNLLIYENFIPFLSVMINTKSYFDVGGIDPSLIQAEDYDLLLKLSVSYDFLATECVCASYRLHTNNNTIKNWEIGYVESEKSIFLHSNSAMKQSAMTKWRAERLLLSFYKEGFLSFLKHRLLNENILNINFCYWIFRLSMSHIIRKIKKLKNLIFNFFETFKCAN